jgi:hypothetical protein
MEKEDRSSRSKSHDDDDDDQKNSRKRKDTDTKLMLIGQRFLLLKLIIKRLTVIIIKSF